jgi:hypothetical protein
VTVASRNINPYQTRDGFGRRVAYARNAILKLGTDALARIYTRKFANCFEMYDGSAVVWALMHEALTGNGLLKNGIERTGSWPHWLEVYEHGQPRDERQLNLFPAPALPA